MEGYFWRFTQRGDGAEEPRAVVALCGINRHPAGDWATVAVAAHPGGFVRSAVVADAWASPEEFRVQAGDVFEADEHSLSVRFGDGVALEATVAEPLEWPLRLGGGGIFSALPFLGQYWHPHVLGGRGSAALTAGDEERWSLPEAGVYAEKNWGAGFPDRWWWGQAHDFEGRDVCIAFGGGRLPIGRFGLDVGGVVVRMEGLTVRFTPPFARVACQVQDARWLLEARKPGGWRLRAIGTSSGSRPHVLPVPVPAERRNVDHDFELLAGTLELTVEHEGTTLFEGTSAVAGLEVGARAAPEAASLRRQLRA